MNHHHVSKHSQEDSRPVIYENMVKTHTREMFFISALKREFSAWHAVFRKRSHRTINSVRTEIATYMGDFEAISLSTGNRWDFPGFQATPAALQVTLLSLCPHTISLCR